MMTNTVITYTNPARLAEIPALKPYLNSLHLCATNSLREGIIKQYQQEGQELIQAPVVSSGMLFSKILGNWSLPTFKLRQFTKLTRLLRSQETEWGKEICLAFKRNQSEVLNSMRMLTEIGIKQSDLTLATREEKFFQRLWNQLESKDIEFQNIRSKLSSGNLVDIWLRKALMESKIDPMQIPGRITEIVFHGFYFITPLQYKMMSLFQKVGIRLVFLNLYDNRYPNTFKSVERFLTQWVPMEEWLKTEFPRASGDCWGDTFASSYEKTPVHVNSDANEPKVIQFQDFQTFLSHYNHHSENEICYSPGQEKLNKRLQDYYPESYPNRHFLAYPIGQYLFNLHQMWDGQKNEMVLSQKGLFECFSSGWLQIEQYNARDYTGTLEDLLPYFSTCRTVKDWREQTDFLKEIKTNVVDVFDHSNRRFHRMMENPMLRFSFLQVKNADLELLIQFMEKLFTQAELLLGKTEIRIHEHFQRIELLLEDGPDPASLAEEEQKLLLELKERLKMDYIDDESYYIDDVAQAVVLYLGGKFNNDEPLELPVPIKNFEDIDAAAFSESEIHLCGLDEESLPYLAKTIPWPLTRQTIQGLKSYELEMLFIREEVSSASARYLFYNALAFAKKTVRLSWIRESEGKKLDESTYILVLRLPKEQRKALFQSQDFEEEHCTYGDMGEAQRFLEVFPADATAEYALCPRRFYYSFIMKPFSSYRDEFHHQFLYQHLLEATYALSNEDPIEIDAQISAFFPHWPPIRKQYLSEKAKKYQGYFSKGYDPYEGRDYIRGRILFQLLLSIFPSDDNNLFKPAFEALKKNDTHSTLVKPIEQEDTLQLHAKPTELCRFCPHSPVCKERHYPVDDKMRSYL